MTVIPTYVVTQCISAIPSKFDKSLHVWRVVISDGDVNLYANPFLDASKVDKYELTIVAKDEYDHISKTEVLTIKINQVNEPPLFTPDKYDVTIEEKLVNMLNYLIYSISNNCQWLCLLFFQA